MGPMAQIGQYFVTVEDSDGNVVEEHELVATGHPAVGEQILLESGLHVVVRVRHEEDAESRTLQRYTHARVFVRRVDEASRAPTPAEQAEATVLPFAPPPPDATTSRLLPPSLLAVLVVAGYAEQKASFRLGWRRLGLLQRAEGRWAAITANQLWRYSRRAKRYMLEAAAWTNALAARATVTWPSSSRAATGTPAPRAAPSTSAPRDSPPATTPPPRSSRPALRLVPGGRARESDDDDAPRER